MSARINYNRITGSNIQGDATTVTEPLGTLVVTNNGDLRLHDGTTAGGNPVGGGGGVGSFGTDKGIGADYASNNPAILFSDDDMIIRTGGTAGHGTIGAMYIASAEELIIGHTDASLTDATSLGAGNFTDYLQIDTNGIEMTTARGTVQFGYNLEAPGVPTHFHINKLDQSFDLFFGDDSNYFHLPAGGGSPVIGANDGSSGQKLWTFGQDGTTQFPNDTIKATTALSIATPETGGIPASVANWNSGGGWNQGTYSNLATTGGTGSGLTVDITGAFGYITIDNIAIHTPGTGYTDGDVITIVNENSGTGTFTITTRKNIWQFGTDGNLIFPNSTVQTTAWTGSVSTLVNGSHTVSLGTDGSLTVPGDIKSVADTGDVVIHANNGTQRTWTFGGDGGLTLPLGGYITAPSAMGSNTVIQAPVSNRALLQNSDGTNLVAADDQGVAMTTVRGTVQFGYNLEAPGVPSHFHINKLDQTFDLFFGDDANYFHLPASGGAPVIGATNTGVVGANTYLWTFGQDGKLTFPDESQQSFAPSTGVGPLNPWGTPFPSGVGVAGTDYQFFFDISNSGRPSIQSYSPNGGYPLYNTIWNIQLYSTALVGNDSSGATPVQVNNTGGVNLCDPIGPGDCAIVRVQNLDTGRVYRATFLGSYNVADTGNETKYGSIIVERLV